MSKCIRCGKSLSDPVSLSRMMGPMCFGNQSKEQEVKIQQFLHSNDTGEQLEANVATSVDGDLVLFHHKFYRENGDPEGDIDVSTSTTIIEVTTSPNGKMKQLRKMKTSLIMNPTQKSVILFAPDYENRAGFSAIVEGFRVTRAKEELFHSLNKINEWRTTSMQQAVVVGGKKISADEFATIMVEIGGHQANEEEFSFAINGTEFIVYFDNNTLTEFEDDDMANLQSMVQNVPQSCIIIECQTGTPIENMREYLVKIAFAIQGVIRIDNIGTFTLKDIEENHF